MKILDRFKNKVSVTNYKLVTESGSGFFNYDGKLYQSDIVRSCIRPKAQAVGKIIGKHIREDPTAGFKINPEAYIKFLLEEPNPYMTGQMLHEKMTVQLMLNNNAFAHIQRDENGYPVAIYPVQASAVEAIQDEQFNLYLKFQCANGKSYTFRYTDIIHIRRDFNNNDIFGDNPAPALMQLMEIVTTTDQGIINAIKNSNVIKWLLKFTTVLKPDDIKKQTKQFVDDFLRIEDASDGSSAGAAATDAKFDAKQVTPNDYVPNAALVDRSTDRIYSFFNTNKKIIQSAFNEDDWISYYESEIEPVVMQLSGEYTRKIFSRRERGFGNKIVFESTNLAFASMQTKLNLVQFVDRGIMNANEVRQILNMAPIADGEIFVRRLDTRPTSE
jgi:HK97 family phage portal protein